MVKYSFKRETVGVKLCVVNSKCWNYLIAVVKEVYVFILYM